ncbi:MAG: helix-turn-helix transcriptional regulator [bacterium]|nr:helix-turn-helix transcriptional regulator [bacterium]
MRQDGQAHGQTLSASPWAQRQLQVGALTVGGKVESVADLGAQVCRARQAAGMTQEELADRIGTTRQWVIRLEQGHRTTTVNMVLLSLSELGLEMVARLDPADRGGASEQ